MDFPLDYVRSSFAELDDGKTTYLDHALASRELLTVRALAERPPKASEARENLETTRESFAYFVNSNVSWAEDEILFVSDARELARRLSLAIAESLEPGSEVLLTEIDEEWSLEPWLELEERGIRTKLWPPKRPGAGIDTTRVDDFVSERTRAVVVAKASKALGTVIEILPVALRVRDSEGLLVVNWTPFVSRGPLDVRFLRADFVLSSTHPLFGSTAGFLWAKRERMRELGDRAPGLTEGIEASPVQIAALAEALRYVEEIGLLTQDMQIQPSEDYGRRKHMRRGMQVIRHYERTLTSLALRRLAGVPGAKAYGISHPDQSAHRMPNIFFGIEGLKPVSIAGALADRGIKVGHGNCGCPRAVRAAGLPEDTGAVCLSLAHYNSEEEVERLSEALHDIVHA